jgi:hypothetical protein
LNEDIGEQSSIAVKQSKKKVEGKTNKEGGIIINMQVSTKVVSDI